AEDVYTCNMPTRRRPPPSPSAAGIPGLPCACANLRRAARTVTRLYDRELADTGIELTRFSLLMALSRAGEVTQGGLGRILSLDSTALTRTLRPLLREGLAQSRPGQDQRERLFSLTAAGAEKLAVGLSGWRRAQSKLHKRLGKKRFNDLLRVLAELG